MKLGLLFSQFPRYDEAFLLREVTALSAGPQELVIFSLRPCRDRVVHAQAQALQPKTVYAPLLASAALWRSHAHFLRQAPGAYLGALGWILGRHWRHPVILLKTLAFFPKTVHFARLAQERGVGHLHAFWATYPASAALIIERLTGISFSLSGHAHDIHTANPALAEKMRAARLTLTCTEANQRFLQALAGSVPGTVAARPYRVPSGPLRRPVPKVPGTEMARIEVCYHGVDLRQFAPAEKPQAPDCHLLAVGSLLPCKGLETLIAACRRLRERGVRFHCTFAGGGPLEGALRRRIARAGLGGLVEITGYVSQERVAGLYRQAHVLVLPLVSKIHWGIPNVLIEALATRTPVICCDLPSMKELVEHGQTGWVIPEGDPQALADAVAALWSDGALRARLADAGHARVVERFALERTGERLRSLLQRAQEEPVLSKAEENRFLNGKKEPVPYRAKGTGSELAGTA